MVHVLLRGVTARQGEQVDVGGRRVAVMGLARPSQWKDSDLLAGDLYGVAWVGEDEISTALATLRKNPKVVDATSDERDSSATRRRRKL